MKGFRPHRLHFRFRYYLPNSHDGVGDEDEENDEGLHKGRDGLLTLLEEGQDEGDDGSQQEDLNQQVVELLQHQLEQGLALLRGEL